MKLIFTLTLTKATITDIWNTILAEGSNESVHEYFRDHILKAHFHSWDMQQDGFTGAYTIAAMPSQLDAAPLFNCFNAFCEHLARLGTNVDGYAPREATVTIGEDRDEMTYLVTVNNGAMPDFECDTYEEATQWIDGFKHAAELTGVKVRVSDMTE